MKLPKVTLHDWPGVPPVPGEEQVVLVRARVSDGRETARQQLRDIVRTVLCCWSGRKDVVAALTETAKGPVWSGTIMGHQVGMSLSYTNEEGWIGLALGRRIGLDAMRKTPFEEMAQVAELYLGTGMWQRIKESPDREIAFARAWTEMEARLKCRQSSLLEWKSPSPERDNGECVRHVVTDCGTVVAVAIA